MVKSGSLSCAVCASDVVSVGDGFACPKCDGGGSGSTADALASMFTENTGRHMLDSGSAYGRAWERNAGMTASDFLARPAATLGEDGEITLDLFHYLNERLTFDPAMTAEWLRFDAERPDDSWSNIMEEWLDALGVPEEGGDFYSDNRWGFNTYNFDGCLLNGTIQGVKFGVDGTEYLALQVHGGCDPRGGYTNYSIFTGDVEGLVLDSTRATLSCPADGCDFYACYSEGSLQDYNLGESLANPNMLIEVAVPTMLPAEWDAPDGCPLHKVALV